MTSRRRLTLLAVTIAATPLVLGGCTAERKPAAGPAERVVPSPELDPDARRPGPGRAAQRRGGHRSSRAGRSPPYASSTTRARLVRAEPREDGSGWVPSAPLRPQRTYTAEVTATGDSGRTTTRTTTFTTMAEVDEAADHQHPVLRRQADVRHRDAGDRRRSTRPFRRRPGRTCSGGCSSRRTRRSRAPGPGWTTAVRSTTGLPTSGGRARPSASGPAWRVCRSARNQVGDADRTATSKIGRQVALGDRQRHQADARAARRQADPQDPGQPRQARARPRPAARW